MRLGPDTETLVRLTAFIGVFVVLAVLEAVLPRRQRQVPRGRRWPANLGIVVLNSITLRLILPLSAMAAAGLAEARGWGLLSALGLDGWPAVLVAVLVLDLVVYWQHVTFHAVPALWRLHRMHHADLDFDVTTGLRFHPLEIVLSMAIKIAAVLALGASPVAVLVFEVLLNAAAMFNHSNLRLSARVDRWVRVVLVTPDMHRVHHSVDPAETHSNFGFSLSLWDRIWRSYRAWPAAGHRAMTIGLPYLRDPRELHLGRMLLQPFRRVR